MQLGATNISRVSLPLAGYFYLHLQVLGAVPQELWAHWGSRDRVGWKSGQITAKPAEPSAASD